MGINQGKSNIEAQPSSSKALTFFLLTFSLISFAALYPKFTFYMRWATLSYVCMLFGLYYRKQRPRHLFFMALAIFSDVSLVLVLEFQRTAIKTALSFTLAFPQQMHIAFSSIAILLYIPVVILGTTRLLKRGGTRTYKNHKLLGITAFLFRTLGFSLMFSLIK